MLKAKKIKMYEIGRVFMSGVLALKKPKLLTTSPIITCSSFSTSSDYKTEQCTVRCGKKGQKLYNTLPLSRKICLRV